MTLRYDPIAVLMEEHRRFLARTGEFLRATAPARANADDPLTPRRISEFAGFLNREVSGLHASKEEQGLFPVLGRHIPEEGGPIAVLRSEHDFFRGECRKLDRSADRLDSDPEATEARSQIGEIARTVDGLLRDHIAKEDEVLFPMAYDVLSDREMTEIAEICVRLEDEFAQVPRR